MSKDKLLPCPFCGGEAEIDATGNVDFYGHEHQDVMVTCKSCEAEIYVSVGSGKGATFSCSCCHDVTAEAVKRWNARAKVPSWISVDTPPENSTWVMIKTTSPLTNDRIVTMAFYEFNEESNETYWLSHHNESGTADGWEDVTHWQPLPPMNGE